MVKKTLGLYLLGNLGLLFCIPLLPLFAVVKYLFYFNIIALPMLALVFFLYRKGHRFTWMLSVVSVLAFGLLIYARYVEPYQLKVRELELQYDQLEGEVKLLHISDIQTNAVGGYEEEVFQTIQQLQPDLIVHTGDLVQVVTMEERMRELEALGALFQQLEVPYGIYNVLGDTDVDRELWVEQFDQIAGIKTLQNDKVELNIRGNSIKLLGLSAHQSRLLNQTKLQWWMDTRHPEDVMIVAGHSPDYVLDIQEAMVNICLAGHTHGGQVRVPFYGPIITLAKVPREWARGHNKVNHIDLNVSAGIGVEHEQGVPPLRFNCPPEITMITLKGK